SGDFSRVHPLPRSSADVPDDLDARLVVLSAEQAYSKEAGSPAQAAAKTLLETRGSTPRLYRNTLVFLAADKVRLQDLDEALRKYLAWESIVVEKETLNLDPHQLRQAEEQKRTADGAVTARVPETYQWLLVPVQTSPQATVEWQAFRLSGQDALAVRASKKLRSDELLVTSFSGTRLRMELDRVPLWSGDHVAIKKPVVARRQLDAEQAKAPTGLPSGPAVSTGGAIATGPVPALTGAPVPVAAQPKRFHGTVTLDPTRVGRDASRVADEVIAHLSGLVGAKVKVTLEVEAEIPSGAPEHVVR